MKKRILLLTLLIIPCFIKAETSGTVNYNLNISDKYNEEIIATFNKDAYTTALKDKSDIPPLEYIFLYDKQNPIKNDIRTEYNKKIEKLNDNIIVKLTYSYSKEDFKKATYLNNCFEYFIVKDEDYYTEYSLSGAFYCRHDKTINISITSDQEIESHNGTKNGNTYSWVIDSNTANIIFKVSKETKQQEEVKEPVEKQKKGIITILITILIILLVLVIIKERKTKKVIKED